MTDTEFYTSALEELKAIRELLARAPVLQPAQSRAASSSSGSRDEEPPPMPNRIWPNAEAFMVPFGKNQGKALGELADNSLSWYCKDPEPKLDSSGRPYPPRQADMELRQAARTVYHRRKGAIPKDEAAPAYPSGAGADLDKDVPFLRRDFDHG